MHAYILLHTAVVLHQFRLQSQRTNKPTLTPGHSSYSFADIVIRVDADAPGAGSGARIRSKVFSTGILKISVVTNNREYWIYQKFIGDRNKFRKKFR
jgi:hypothetical protein